MRNGYGGNMNKQVSILYFSATKGTEMVIRGIAEGIGNHFNEYNITLPNNRKEEVHFGPNDLVIIGFPVYAGRIPAFLMDYILKIKGDNTPAVFLTVYGNRHYDDALLELKNTFEENGFIGIAAGAFVAEHSNTSKVGTNRPDVKDLELAKEFGVKIKNKINQNIDKDQLSDLIVKGSFPYKERPNTPPIAPTTSSNCINCGICANHCPTGAINFNDYSDIDATKCVRCCSCIKRCPVNAKSINHEIFNKITQGLIQNFSSVRKEPEWFI